MAFRRVRTLRKLTGNSGIRAVCRRTLDAMLRDMQTTCQRPYSKNTTRRNGAWHGTPHGARLPSVCPTGWNASWQRGGGASIPLP